MTYSDPPREKFITIVTLIILLNDNPVSKVNFFHEPYIHPDRSDSIFDISQLYILSSLSVHKDSRRTLCETCKISLYEGVAHIEQMGKHPIVPTFHLHSSCVKEKDHHLSVTRSPGKTEYTFGIT